MKLRRRLGLSDVFSIATGAMISSGIFVLPGLAHARAGPAVALSYLIAGLFASTGLLSVAELTTAMPKAGGDYFFVSRGMGPAAGTVAGILTWFALSLKVAFALVGMTVFAQLVLPADPHLVGVAFCLFFVGLNVIGVKEAARLQVVLVAALLALMALYIVRGLPMVDVQRFEPFAPHGARAVFATAGLVFVSYGGLLKVASISEEVREPGRLLPLGMVLSWVVACLMYVLIVFVTSGVLDAHVLDRSTMPISLGAEAIMGRPGMIALSVAAILAFLTTANGGIMAASRYLLALSRDGLIPEPFGRIGQRFRTPHVALLVTGALVLAALFVRLEVLVGAASAVFMSTYVLANLAVIILRESRLQNYRPKFRAPLYPWVQIAGIVGILFVIVEMGGGAFLTVATLALLGFLVYWLYGRARSASESALLHLVERVTAKELVTGTLEEELKEIIHERDGVREDLFDGLVKRGPVVDMEGAMSHGDFFALAAERLGPRVGVEPGELRELLLARERETSTVLAPGLAIPHVVIPGAGTFELLMARSRAGVAFPGAGAPVHAAFVLVGTLDQRNMHLRALSAIAQVVQGRDFEKRWMRARGEQALRDVLLLGERRRVHDE
ncbi:MAG: amino acid permease [Candidatus Eisenbacteria bacterium]|nr:amino acid permease [Candidatus Eisenbacteria bacterium]